jgi:hypothetical protein
MHAAGYWSFEIETSWQDWKILSYF